MPDVLVRVERAVAVVTLNRPERNNAWSPSMAAAMNDVLTELDGDDEVRAIVVTGAGSAFCVGADLGDAEAFVPADGFEDPTDWRRLVTPWSLRKPVVAAINGHAVGVGITYALQCDLRFVAADAKIVFAFVRRGVLPELASHVLLPRVVGTSVAADLLLSGRTITGTEAARLGLANQALPAGDVLAAAVAWATDVATNTAPVSVALAKRLLWDGLTATPREMQRRESDLMPWICSQPDAVEGVSAFLDRRTPAWTMRPTVDVPPGP